MKRIAQFLSVLLVTTLVTVNAFAQDLAAVTEAYNTAATALNDGKTIDALTGFQKALKDATALGEEGQGIANDCKNIIPKILLSLGKESANAKNLDQATDYLHQAIKAANEYSQPEVATEAKDLIPVILMADGNSLLNDGKFAEAVVQYNKVIAEDAQNGTAYLRLGMAQAKLDNEAAAIAAFTKAAEFGEKANADKQLATLYTNKAILAFKAKNNAAALENALKADEFGANPQVAKIGGIAAFNLNKFDDAIKLLEEVISATPNANDARYYLARAYEGKGNKVKALENYKIIVGDPKFKAFAESKIKALGA